MNVSPEEKLTRFIRQPKDCKNNIISHRLFLPRKRDTGISVFRISGLSAPKVWEIAWCHVEKQGGDPIIARADFLAGAATKIGIEIIADGDGHERHVSIPVPQGYSDDGNMKRQTIARKLASASTLEWPPVEMR